VYLAEIAIPLFRQKKIEKYIFAMSGFSYEEMLNADKHLGCWGGFKTLADGYLASAPPQSFY